MTKPKTHREKHQEQIVKKGVKEIEDRRVTCIYCKEPIHIDRLAGFSKRGMFCNNGICLIKLVNDEARRTHETKNEIYENVS